MKTFGSLRAVADEHHGAVIGGVEDVVEDRLQVLRACPHCAGMHVVRNGMARGLQRYRCRGCGKTFNALTYTPLARCSGRTTTARLNDRQ